ncbi:MAG: family 14 glycosylhydrolase [Spirochaetes bacterium]|nr:family 14 glycosylhydrolase [Spirochaetota bacterium]
MRPANLLIMASFVCAVFAAPDKPAHDIWIEGESSRHHDFTTVGTEKTFGECYGSAILQLQTIKNSPAGGYHAAYVFTVPENGYYELSLAATKTGVPHISDYTMELTGHRPRHPVPALANGEYGPNRIFAWQPFGRFFLAAGEASVTVRCTERRSDSNYLVYIDALTLRRVDAPRSDARWITTPNAGAGKISAELSLDDAPDGALFTGASDGAFEITVNGTSAGRGTGWERITGIPLPMLRAGKNTVTVTLSPEAAASGIISWISADGERGRRTNITQTDDSWRSAAEKIRVLGDAFRAPWGDMTLQQAPKISALGRCGIPVKTGNLSVNLIKAAVRGEPMPAPQAHPEFNQWKNVAGITSAEDYICWLPLEPERDAMRWDYYERNCRELEARGMKYAVYPWLHFAPPWALTSEYWDPLRCIEHNESTFAPSIWSPATIALFDRFYGKLAARFGSRIGEINVSMICDYGEVGYPIGMADWVVPAKHKHAGYWCGDSNARAHFSHFALTRYRSVEALNNAWGTSFADAASISYPPWFSTEGPPASFLASCSAAARVQARHRWLDFCEWYLNSMVDFAEKAVATSRAYFPSTPHEIKVGFGNERVMYGADNTAFVARSRTGNFRVRSTHGKLPLYFYRRFSTAAKLYGVPLVTEPPADVSRDEEVERIYKDAISGTKEFFDYVGNTLRASDLFSRYGRYLEGDHSLTTAAFFFPTTDHRLRAGQHIPLRLKTVCAAAVDYFDYDVVDERLIRDGALTNLRVLIMPDGNIVDRDVLTVISGWVRSGGVLIAADNGKLESMEGDRTMDASLFAQREKLPKADELWTISASSAAASMIDVGASNDASCLTGDWHGPESGHFEWGGKPNSVTKRWTGSNAHLYFAADPLREHIITLAFARNPKMLNAHCEIIINGVSAGSLLHERTGIFQARIMPGMMKSALVDVAVVSETWTPSQIDKGSKDIRTIGVAIDWGKCRPADTGEPETAPLPVIRRNFDASLFTARCVSSSGNGATVLVPVTDAPGDTTFVETASAIVHGSLVPGIRKPPVADGVNDGVWCSLLPKRILLCNTTDAPVEKRMTIDPSAFGKSTAIPVRADTITVRLDPHSLASIELPSCRVRYP